MARVKAWRVRREQNRINGAETQTFMSVGHRCLIGNVLECAAHTGIGAAPYPDVVKREPRCH